MATEKKNIQGDLSVSRSVEAGSDLCVGGNVAVGHNVRIEGWLEARHIAAAMKGLFGSADALRQRWPRPEPGWFALVGDTLPADIYRADNGSWVPTGRQGGEPEMMPADVYRRLDEADDRIGDINEGLDALTVDVKEHGTDLDKAKKDIQNLKTDVTALKEAGQNAENPDSGLLSRLNDRITKMETSITDLRGTLTTHIADFSREILELREAVKATDENILTVEEKMAKLATRISKLEGPGTSLRFDRIILAMPLSVDQSQGTSKSPFTDKDVYIVYCEGTKTFIIEDQSELQPKYYVICPGMESYGDSTGNGIVPNEGGLYHTDGARYVFTSASGMTEI